MDTLSPERTIEGTWEEIVSHADEVKHKKHLRLIVFPEEDSFEEEKESQRLLGVLEAVLDEIDPAEAEPANSSDSPFEAAVVEKYREQGWSV